MKRLLALLLCLTVVFTFSACGGDTAGTDGGDDTTTAVSFDDIDDNCESEDGTYQIAMVTDVGQLKDGSFNQFTWNGCKMYAHENGKTYKYYQPANGSNATDEDRIKAMTDACEAGAEAIVAPGFLQITAISTVSPLYPDVQFIFIDGWDTGLPNVIGVSYQEEQAGYLAGYATVMDGYTKLGFSGGGGGSNPACNKYGYGFCQGANDAAADKGVTVEMRYSWEYGSQFSASDDLQAMLAGWYNAGTEAIFVCGGTMSNSGFAAAEAADGKIIGVDTDQSGFSGTVITSATKGLAQSVQLSLADFYANGMLSGSKVYGAADDAVGIPTDPWTLETWTLDEYNALFDKVMNGEVTIDNNPEISDPSTAGLANMTFVS